MFDSLVKYGILFALVVMLVLPGVQILATESEMVPNDTVPDSVQRAVAAEQHGRPNVDPSSLRRGVLRYLDQGFFLEEMGTAGEWWHWIIVDEGDWTVGQLRMVRGAIVNTMAALDDLGLDGQAMLAGYRFRRVNSRYVHDIPGRRAQVNHAEKVVLLADDAFMVYQGFFIYHELGHIIDRASGRALSSGVAERAIERNANPAGPEVVDGYWMRDQARTSPSEAAADAFALWVLVDFSGYDLPSFPTSPNRVDAAAIFFLVELTLDDLDG